MSDRKLLGYVVKNAYGEYWKRTCVWSSDPRHFPSIRDLLDAWKDTCGTIYAMEEVPDDGPGERRLLDDREACPEGAELKWVMRAGDGTFVQASLEGVFGLSNAQLYAVPRGGIWGGSDVWRRVAVFPPATTVVEREVK